MPSQNTHVDYKKSTQHSLGNREVVEYYHYEGKYEDDPDNPGQQKYKRNNKFFTGSVVFDYFPAETDINRFLLDDLKKRKATDQTVIPEQDV